MLELKLGCKLRSIKDSHEHHCPATIKEGVAQTKASHTEGAEGPDHDNSHGPILGNHGCPGPSSPVGQRMLRISWKSGPDEEEVGSTATFSRGTGMGDEESGEVLEENGTLGLFVVLITPPWKFVRTQRTID